MTLASGKTLGSFEISSLLGVGAMGEVYRARDIKLGRQVAIKVLPEMFAQDKDRLARFEREARVLAALNHPNIAAIYDFGHQNDTHYLVMELVEGPSLDIRLKKGPLPPEEALPLFSQIAEALEKAHEQGIIHRDLKPGNIKVTEEGRAKILDFGLAKAFEDPILSGSDSDGTVVDPAGRTGEGRVLGTPAYMSPEQARGQKVDKRADIWAYGCCLFEALSGRRPFKGETASDLLAQILTREPDWTQLPADTPRRIRELLWRALQKDPRRRLRDIGDAWFEISTLSSDPTGSGSFENPGPTTVPSTNRSGVVLAAVLAFLAGALITGGALLLRPEPEQVATAPQPKPVRRYSIALPGDMPIAPPSIITDVTITLSPDGKTLVYTGTVGGTRQLVQRALDSFEAHPIAGTEGASFPFFSPDGQWLGFYVPSERKLKKVSIRGGPPTTICDASFPLGATWGKNDTIIFASEITSGLRKVSAQGGQPETLTKLDPAKREVYHTAPRLFGDESALFFVVSSAADVEHSRLEILELATGKRKVMSDRTGGSVYSPSGHYLAVQPGSLVVRPFDLAALEPRGAYVPINESRLVLPTSLPTQYALSNEGLFIFVPVRSGSTPGRTLVWLDRTGKETPTSAPPAPYSNIVLSPDGARVAVNEEYLQDVFLLDLEGGHALTRFTFEASSEAFPLWAGSGDRLFFGSQQTGVWNIYSKSSDGTGSIEEIVKSPLNKLPWCVHPTQDLLVFTGNTESTKTDIGIIDLSKPEDLKMILEGSFNETQPAFSPDGQWLAYTSDETGRDEIFVQPFPSLDGKWQISDKGGNDPLWGKDGKELYYRDGTKLMVVKIDSATTFRPGRSELLFDGPYYNFGSTHSYAFSPEGDRFLMIRDAEGAAEGAPAAPRVELSVVENFFEEINRIAPPPASTASTQND